MLYKLPERQSPSSWEGHWWDEIHIPCQVPRAQKSKGNSKQTPRMFLFTPRKNSAGSVRCVSDKLSSHVFHGVATAECTQLLLKPTQLQAVEEIHA